MQTERNTTPDGPAPPPGWLEQVKAGARSRAEELPFPTGKEERWRFTDLSLLRPDGYALRTGPRSRSARLPEEAARWLADDGPVAGRIVHVDGVLAELELGADARRMGVVLAALEEAAALHAELLAPRLGRLVTPDDHFSARALAHADGGVFLHVPAGVAIEGQVQLGSWLGAASAGLARYPRAVVVVGEGASVTFSELFGSTDLPAGAAPTLVAPTVELYIGAGARVGWSTWQELGRGQRYFANLAAHLERDAELEAVLVSLGASYSRSEQRVVLAGEGARSVMLGAYYPAGSQKVEHWTVQDHRAPNTTSDLLHVGVLADEARSVYYGTIRIAEGARRSDAYQANRNLVLSAAAKADTNPQLEIANNDVRCTHGATVGPLDREAMFYLMSRGIPRPGAERLVVQGFFGKLLGRMKRTGLAPRLAEAVRRKAGAPS